jgi:hypothetical protein
MPGLDLLATNLLQPILLAFVLGAIAGFLKSELELPEPVIKLLSIILLFSIGITGGREIAQVRVADIADTLLVTVLLIFAIPTLCFVVLRRLGGFDAANAGAVAAHYGSVSTATFFASVAFARAMNTPSEGFITAFVAMMEFAVIFSIALARWSMGREKGGMRVGEILLDTLRGRGRLPRRAAGGEPGPLPHLRARDHAALQPAGRDPPLLPVHGLAVRVRRRAHPRPAKAVARGGGAP